MAVKADGTLIIETGADLDGFQADCEKLQQSAKRAAKNIQAIEKNLESVMKALEASVSEADSGAEAAEQKAKRARKESKGAAKSAKEAAREAGKAKKELEGLKDQKITITRMEDTPQSDYDGPLREPEYIDYGKLQEESAKAMEEIRSNTMEAEKGTNSFFQSLENAKNKLNEIEAQGFGPDDEVYDRQAAKVAALTAEYAEYSRSVASAGIAAIKDFSTLEGKMAAAEAEIQRLTHLGFGIETDEMQDQIRYLAETREQYKALYAEVSKTDAMRQKEQDTRMAKEAKAAAAAQKQAAREEARAAALNAKLEEAREKEAKAAAEARHLQEIGDNAQVSKQKITELVKRLDMLKERQKELERAGVGLGYTEYDKNAKEIERIEKRLKRYEDSVKGAQKKTKAFSKALGSAAKRVSRLAGAVSKGAGVLVKGAGKSARAMAGLNKQAKKNRMSMGKMLATSILFSSVFRAISAITGGIGEGFQNLAQYSDETNTSLSVLISAMTRLKNSFATAFSPLLTVVSPILVDFINLISRALTYVGMFFAALTGKESFVKATGVQQDYRASLSGTAGAASDAADATGDLADATKKAEKENNSYLSGLDEIRRWESTKEESSGNHAGGNSQPSDAGNLLPEDMFETVAIENSIKGMTDKIRKLIEAEDWEGLGKYVAKGLNKGLKKVYNVISWKKVGPKVTKFTKAFTESFNSLVKYLDFDLMGRTVGTGINTLVKTFNLLIGPGGIDFDQIGRKLSQGLRGAIREIGWPELGNLFGNYFMISWDILGGFVRDMAKKDGAGLTGWEELGSSIGQAVNGAFARISFTDAGIALTDGINGLFQTLLKLAEETEWDEMADNVSDGLNASFSNMKWEEAGKSLDTFLGNLVGFLVQILEKTDWEEFGSGLGTLLSQIDWGGHLWDMIAAIAGAIGNLFDGLEEGGTAGKIAAFLGKVFLAVKIADITGIGDLVRKLVAKIGAKLISEENIVNVAGKLKSLFGSGTEDAGDLLTGLGTAAGGASGKFASLAESLAPLVGTAGLISGVTVGILVLTEGVAGLIEQMQGGNGTLTDIGAGLHNFADGLLAASKITKEQSDELYTLIENNESAKLSNEEMYNSLIAKLQEYGLSAADARSVLESYGVASSTTAEVIEGLRSRIAELGEGTSQTAEQINMSGITVEEAWGGIDEVFRTLIQRGDALSGSYQGLLYTLDNTRSSSTNAQSAIDSIITALTDAGLPTDEFIRLLGEEFPGAVQAVKTSVDTNIVGAQQTVTSSMETAGADVKSTVEGMKADAEANLPGIQKTADEAFGGIDDTTVTKWGNSASEVKKNLEAMKQAAAVKLGEMGKTVSSHSESMYNTMTKKWEYMSSRISQILKSMNSDVVVPKMENVGESIRSEWESVENATERTWNRIGQKVAASIEGLGTKIRNQMNSVIGTVNNGITNINHSISGIEAAMNFGPWQIPTATGSRTIGFSATFPRVSQVPYLASGAVIPPRSEFLAVLGDQKHGNNIETPEALLRKVVREESGSSGGGIYRFVGQINRRVLFEEMMTEAQLVQSQTGRNPFEMA